MDNIKIVVVQYWTNNLSYSKYTEKINGDYCEKHGYIYHVENDTNKIIEGLNSRDRAFQWYKVLLVREVLEKYNPDYVFYLDADAIFVDYENVIENFIYEDKEIVCTQDYGPSRMNSGVMIFKNTEWVKNFLDRWYEYGETAKGGHENLQGFYKHGLWHEQTCFGNLYDGHEDIKEKVAIIDNKILNGRYFKDTQNKNFIFHAFSYGMLPNRTIDSAYHTITGQELPKGEQIIDIINYYSTDKHHEHNYVALIYNDLFREIKNEVKQFLEIGINTCQTLRLWRDYFTDAKIIGVDNNMEERVKHMEGHSDKNIVFHDMDPSKDEDMEKLSEMYENIDVIIEDSTHIMKDQQMIFAKLFKTLKSGGLYILEDLHTSIELVNKPNHWISWGDSEKTITLDMLEEFKKTGKIVSDYMTEDEINYLNENIESVEIYRNRPDWSITSIIKKK